jgi:uncharacterized membrane protein
MLLGDAENVEITSLGFTVTLTAGEDVTVAVLVSTTDTVMLENVPLPLGVHRRAGVFALLHPVGRPP